MPGLDNGVPVVRQKHPSGQGKTVFEPAFLDHPRQASEFRLREYPRTR